MSQRSKLLGELLDAIEEKLVLYNDKVRVRAVCKSWNSHLQKMPNLHLKQLPWLLLENEKKSSHSLFNLREKKFSLHDLPAKTQGKVFKGSSQGRSHAGGGEGDKCPCYNSSISMSSRHFPGYKGNRIYFTDGCYSYMGKINKQEDSDIGIFNLEDDSFEQLPGLKSSTKFFWPPPIWVTPSGTY
ncbi:hypothetical protein LguiB_032698 [Lonicera macranthoides]